MTTYKFIALLWVSLLAASCSNDHKENASGSDSTFNDTTLVTDKGSNMSDADSLLIPGTSAGVIRLNQDAAEVYKIYGKADSGDAAMQKAVAFWFKGHNPTSYSTAIYTVRDTGDNPPARIRQIRVTLPGYRTAEGFGIGSSVTELTKTFEVDKVKPAKALKADIYDSIRGITFEIGKDSLCTAVIIHKAGEPLSATYLPFW